MSGDEIRAKFAEALANDARAVIPVGRWVACDNCVADMTEDPRTGGYLFGSYAVGPCCMERHLASVRQHREEWNIRARCPEGTSFADWVRGLRGPDAAIRVTPGTSAIRTMGGDPS